MTRTVIASTLLSAVLLAGCSTEPAPEPPATNDQADLPTGQIVTAPLKAQEFDFPGRTEGSVETCDLEVTLDDEVVSFDKDSAALDAQAREVLAQVAVGVEGVSRLTVTGHTSTEGSAEHNLDLSERRAQAVAEVLQAALPEIRIDVIAKGEREPIVADEDSEAARRQNRRVVIATVLSHDGSC